MTRVLLIVDREPETSATGPLVATLRTWHQIELEVATVDRLLRSPDAEVIILATRNPLTTEAVNVLVAHLRLGGRRRVEGKKSSVGGGLLLLGNATDAWRAHEALQGLIGPLPATPFPRAEIIAHPVGDHMTTSRLDEDIVFEDAVIPLAALPDDATPLLTMSWRYTRQTLAMLRPVGEGHLAYLGITGSTGLAAYPAGITQFIARLARYLGGWRTAGPIGMAMLGYGAIGFEHASAITTTPGLAMRVVCDRSPERLEVARVDFPDARITTEADEIAVDPTVDAVIIGTPPNTHARLALQMLQAGKHVIVEKPFCMTVAEADGLIAAARERDLALTVYQNRRWDADFVAIREVIQSGAIGEIFHLETFIGGYDHPCDYWHSHEPISGGVFYDWGSHYLDWVLQLLAANVRDVRATAHKRVWQDVTNADQAHLVIHFADGAEASFIHSDVAALLKPKWYVLGTRGAIIGQWRDTVIQSRKWNGDLVETPLAPSEALPEITVAIRDARGQMHHQRLGLPPAPRHPFHRNFADHLLVGAPLAVPPTSSRRNIAVMEAAAYSAAHGSEVIVLDTAEV